MQCVVRTGLVAFVYYHAFEGLITLVWHVIPKRIVEPGLMALHQRFPAHWAPVDRVAWVYIVLASTSCGLMSGVVQKVLGAPGDLPDTVKWVHETGIIPAQQVPSMFISSAFGIAAGGSLGPEAALVALCGATVSWVAKNVFKCKADMLRQCTLMGMSAALSAFFGVLLGGSLFALEVLHRTGLQHFEVLPYATTAGAACIFVFRGLMGKPFGALWPGYGVFNAIHWWHLPLGAAVGAVTGLLAIGFTYFHKSFKRRIAALGVHEHHTPVLAGVLGGLAVAAIGLVLPQTMFWGEYEIGFVAQPETSDLPHVWPQGGALWGMHRFLKGAPYPPWLFLAIAAAKLLAISLSVIAGFRGGMIFPINFVGACLGQAANRALADWGAVPHALLAALPPALLAMMAASGLTVAITRTALSTPIILMALTGQAALLAPCLCASLVALFVSLNVPFMDTQQDRNDVIFKYLVVAEEGPFGGGGGEPMAMAAEPPATTRHGPGDLPV